MVKKTILIALILCSSFIHGAAFDFGYTEANDTRILLFKNQMPFTYKGFQISPFQHYKDSNAGYMVNLNLEVKRDIFKQWDIFFDADYLTDEILEVYQQVDLMVGAGYEFFNNYNDRHKISYACMIRDVRILHSFRYKYTHIGRILDIKAIVFYVMPINEVRGDFGADFKILKALALTLNHSYKAVNGRRSYLSTAGFKIKY